MELRAGKRAMELQAGPTARRPTRIGGCCDHVWHANRAPTGQSSGACSAVVLVSGSGRIFCWFAGGAAVVLCCRRVCYDTLLAAPPATRMVMIWIQQKSHDRRCSYPSDVLMLFSQCPWIIVILPCLSSYFSYRNMT